MTDQPITTLDRHRGMAAQQATELRRLQAEVEANEKAVRERQAELETRLTAAPAATIDPNAAPAPQGSSGGGIGDKVVNVLNPLGIGGKNKKWYDPLGIF